MVLRDISFRIRRYFGLYVVLLQYLGTQKFWWFSRGIVGVVIRNPKVITRASRFGVHN